MVSAIDRAMVSVVRLLGRSLRVSEVASAIAEAAAQLPGVEAAAVLRVDAEAQQLVVDADTGLSPAAPRAVPLGQSPGGRAIADGEAVRIDDLDLPPRLIVPEPARGGRFRGVIAAPLPGEETPARVISVYRQEPGGFPDETAEFLTMLAEAAQSALSNARAFEREERIRREQEAIDEAALAMSSELELDRLLQLITARARDLVGARYAALGVPGPDGKLERFITTGISPMQRERIGPLPQGHGLLGALLSANKVIRLRRIEDDPRAFGFPPHHPPMQSLLGVPVLFRGRNVGDLYLTDKLDGPEFTVDDERIVVKLAAHAAIAIVNATSYSETNEQLRQNIEALAEKNRELQRLSNGILAAQEEERQRIARDLHDDTMQALAALNVRARLIERGVDIEAMRAGVEEIRAGIAQTLHDLRRLAYDLRPTALDDLGLTAALAGLTSDFAARTGVALQTNLDTPEQRLPAPAEVVLYRIAQEALSNVARHAQATHVRVELAIGPETIRLTIADNGRGFVADRRRASREGGLGLLGMEERMQALRGQLVIDSAEGEGTTVSVGLPREAHP